MDPIHLKPAGRPSLRDVASEVHAALTDLIRARREQCMLDPSSFVQGSKEWKIFRIGKISGTTARQVRVNGRGKVSLFGINRRSQRFIEECCLDGR